MDSKRKASYLLLGWRCLLGFLLAAGVTWLGIRHYRKFNTTDSGPVLSKPIMIEDAGEPRRSRVQKIQVDGLDLQITRFWENGTSAQVADRFMARNFSRGWELMKTQGESIPLYLRGRPEFAFNCYLTPQNQVVGYAFDPDGPGTRITETVVDLRQVLRRAAKNGIGGVPDTPVKDGALMPSLPRIAMQGAGEDATRFYMVPLTVATLGEARKEISGRFANAGWSLEPLAEMAGKTGLIKTDGEMIIAAKQKTICHVFISREKDGITAAYRFSEGRPARRQM